jgi:hypothetical protein
MRVVARLLGTRYGIALVLGLLVLGIIGVAQLVGGRQPDGGLRSGPDIGVTVNPNPSAGDDGESTPLPESTPVTSPGAPGPETIATSFASAWVNHAGATPERWLARLKPYMTTTLRESLTGVDPAGVPADRVTGAAKVIPRSEEFVEVTVPVDSGVLRLRLIATAGLWLVDDIDWERA